MVMFALASQPEWSLSIGVLAVLSLVLFGGGFMLCGNVVSLGPPPVGQHSVAFRIGRMVMLLGLLTAVATASIAVVALIS
jgi:multisubunit Na+/H+ antiporter MnhE subunit